MSFYKVYDDYKAFDFKEYFGGLTDDRIRAILGKEYIDLLEYLALLSPAAENHLEEMAQKAHRMTVHHFGKTILLYTPMYLSNYCTNQCVYCSFHEKNDISRQQLSLEAVEEEAKAIAAQGLKHILLLTGDARKIASIEYLSECIKVVKKYFSSVSLEIYALTEAEYKALIEVGVDGLTIYQETYNEDIYDVVHPKGPKKDYHFRLDAPERACKAWMRAVNVGALLGLDEWRKEAFYTGMHANYLQNNYLGTEVSLSFPRLRPHLGSYEPNDVVNDKNLVQMILAARIFMPRAGITISTRESATLRNHLLKLGVTKMSAGSKTAVGGHTQSDENVSQFDIADIRDVQEMSADITKFGYQPVLKDW